MIDLLSRHFNDFLGGLGVTLRLCCIIWVISLLFGSLLGFLASIYVTTIGLFLRVLTATSAGVPPIVLLFWFYYPAQSILRINVDPFTTACVAISFIGIIMVADILAGVSRSFPRQYVVAARVSGLTATETFVRIVVPIAARQLMPSLLNFLVITFQMTLFAAFISVDEIFRTAQRVNSIEYKPVEVYTALALFCMVVSVPLFLLSDFLRARMTRDISES